MVTVFPLTYRWRWRMVFWLALVGLVLLGRWAWRQTSTAARLERGELALRSRAWMAVEAEAARLEAAGDWPEARYLRGESLRLRGRPAEALNYLELIPQDSPLHRQAALAVGRCLLDLKQYPEAERIFRYLVGVQPELADAHRGLGVIAYDLGQMADAIESLEQAATLDPSDGRPHRLIGLIYKDLSKFDEAEAAYRQALDRSLPEGMPREIWLELAETYLGQTRYLEALSTLGKLGPVAADEAALGIELEARRGLGQTREAEALAEQAVMQFPRSARLARLRGQLYLDEKQLPQARAQLERATQLNPVDDQAWYLLGLLYRQQGDARAAQTAEARAAELRQIYARLTELSRQAIQEPANPDLRDELARLCRQIQREDLAQMWDLAARNLRQPPRTDP